MPHAVSVLDASAARYALGTCSPTWPFRRGAGVVSHGRYGQATTDDSRRMHSTMPVPLLSLKRGHTHFTVLTGSMVEANHSVYGKARLHYDDGAKIHPGGTHRAREAPTQQQRSEPQTCRIEEQLARPQTTRGRLGRHERERFPPRRKHRAWSTALSFTQLSTPGHSG